MSLTKSHISSSAPVLQTTLVRWMLGCALRQAFPTAQGIPVSRHAVKKLVEVYDEPSQVLLNFHMTDMDAPPGHAS